MDYLIYNLADSRLRDEVDASLLSEEECAQVARRGERYLISRCLLRLELARRLACEPQDIRFRYGEHGKPECDGLAFNLSHSGDYLAIAVDNEPVGIDVECIHNRKNREALAARIMCPQQLAAFRERRCPEEEFFACWCTAEALVKQAGESIWQAQRHPFVYEQGRICLPKESALSVRLFTPAPGYMGAVACLRRAEG